MKTISIILLTVMLTSAGFSLEIKALDGMVYKKVEVINKNPIGLYIAYWDENQKMTIVKEVKFKNLPESIRKQYNYSPKKAEKYHKHLEKIIAKSAAKAKIRAEKKKKYEKNMEKVNREITNILNANKVYVKIHVIKASGDGCICWASSYNGDLRTSMDQIYILGINEPQGNVWEGDIYPLNQTTTGENMSYTGYVTPFDRAFGIWKNRYLQTGSLGIGGKKKKE